MIDFNLVIFVILLVANIMLCLTKVPILGFVVGFFTVVISGAIFISDIDINVYFTYLLIIIAFSTMLINGIDAIKK